MTKPQRMVPLVVGVVLLIAVVYSLIPFKFAGSVDCGAPLLGAKPGDERPPEGSLIRPKTDCKEAARTKLLVSATAALLATAAGTAMIYLKPESRQCLNGNHEDCPDGWQPMLGSIGAAFACQCSCHENAY